METKTKNSNTTSPSPKRQKTTAAQYSAQEKVQAVLAIWTDRCRPTDLCRQLNIPAITLSQWQQRAMEGMLQALESRANLSNGQLLSPRLQALLTKRQAQMNTGKLSRRLEQIQLAKPEEKPKKTE